jgi:hypothetical protein
MAPPSRLFWSLSASDLTLWGKDIVSYPIKEGIMDKRLNDHVNFGDVVRFGLFMAAEAQRVEYKGGDALAKLFDRARPMLAPRRR